MAPIPAREEAMAVWVKDVLFVGPFVCLGAGCLCLGSRGPTCSGTIISALMSNYRI